MTSRLPQDETVLDLLVERATQGLSAADSAELDRLLSLDPDLDQDAIDLAAAAIDVAFLKSAERLGTALPPNLRASVLAGAAAHFVDEDSASRAETDADVGNVRTLAEPIRAAPPRRRFIDTAGWYAAAAMLLLAVFFGVQRAPTVDEPSPEPSSADLRAGLLSEAQDVVQIVWGASSEPGYESVQGDVVWSNTRQTGFMRLTGLPANRPQVEQYQLWIVDPQRDERPIDGGVFDIPAGADEVIVPIDAKLLVAEPAAFAITLEQPGGVVVSDGPLLIVAAAQAA